MGCVVKSICTKQKQFMQQFELRLRDMHMQQCFGEMETSNRCRTYRNIKQSWGTEQNLERNLSMQLRTSMNRFRLSSHRSYVERGRWSKAGLSTLTGKATYVTQMISRMNSILCWSVHVLLQSGENTSWLNIAQCQASTKLINEH